jgi:hypothetical protein
MSAFDGMLVYLAVSVAECLPAWQRFCGFSVMRAQTRPESNGQSAKRLEKVAAMAFGTGVA